MKAQHGHPATATGLAGVTSARPAGAGVPNHDIVPVGARSPAPCVPIVTAGRRGGPAGVVREHEEGRFEVPAPSALRLMALVLGLALAFLAGLYLGMRYGTSPVIVVPATTDGRSTIT